MTAQRQTVQPAPAQSSSTGGVLQRTCACGNHSGAGGECEECKKKREGMLQRAAIGSPRVDDVPPIVHDVLRSPGQPLDAATRAFMEPRFGHDFSRVRVHLAAPVQAQGKLTIGQPGDLYEQEADRVADAALMPPALPAFGRVDAGTGGLDLSSVRVHTDQRAAESARAVHALAYTVGHDIVFAAGQFQPTMPSGQRLLAHELTHVVQSAHGGALRRQLNPAEPARLTRLRQLLRDDQENAAIQLMGQLGTDEVIQVLASREFKELAMDAFNNGEMYRAIQAMRGNLYPSLEWMFDEGTSWSFVRNVLVAGAGRGGIERVRTDGWMMEQFIKICNNREMAEAVDLLGGTLLQKFTWMAAEGASWALVRAKIVATTNPLEKTALYASNAMRDFFVDVCNNREMAEAVDLLGGTLLQKFTWMAAEGASWALVRAKIVATTNPLEKTALYASNAMRDFFVDVCNNREMAEAVDLLGGTLLQKLQWMLAEGTDFELVSRAIHLSPATELPPVAANRTVMDGLRSELSRGDFNQVTEMLNRLASQQVSFAYTEQHLERPTATAPYVLTSFGKTAAYEIQYTHAEVAVVVRINITGAPTTASERERWADGIKETWNDKFHFENDHRLRIAFEPVFTSAGAQHTVTMHANRSHWPGCTPDDTGACREDGANWFNNTGGDTAAHEFGHMIGLEDEYQLAAADYQRLTNNAPPAGPMPASGYTLPTIMGSGTSVEGRHLNRFLGWLNSNRQPGERPYRLVRGR